MDDGQDVQVIDNGLLRSTVTTHWLEYPVVSRSSSPEIRTLVALLRSSGDRLANKITTRREQVPDESGQHRGSA